MKGNEKLSKTDTPVNAENPTPTQGRRKLFPFLKALDARSQPIRGLWVRNGRFYARLALEDANTGRKQVRRIPLDVETVAQAQAKLRELLTKRERKALPVLRQTPKFKDYVENYLDYYTKVKAKREKTLACERVHLRQWVEHLGDTRLSRINKPMVMAFIEKRKQQGVTARTVNLAMVILRNVLRKAIDDGWLTSLPTENLRPLKHSPRKRQLVTLNQIDKLCEVALTAEVDGHRLKNGQQLADYIRLMAFCGARRTETLGLKWQDVDWDRKQLTIGADGMSKNRQHRVVDFNAKLEAHLRDMVTRRASDSDWLFPSPRRGEQDRAAKTFVESLRIVRKLAGLPRFGFHDCRHFFISYSVMAGIDYMTIAKWVGHKDGGVLIGRVYGHLADEHAKLQARRLSFG